MVAAAYGDTGLKKTQIYAIIKNVKEGKPNSDQRKSNGTRKIPSPAFIADVAAAIEKDRRQTVRRLPLAHGVSKNTIHHTFKEDLNLSKKSARWVPKLLTEKMKKERVRTSEAFLAMVHCRSKAILENIVTMDESAVSFHTPETKQQSKQWLKKGEPEPIIAKVHATRAKQMVLAFFDAKVLIYTNYVPKGTTVNAKYIVEALGTFLKVLRKKRPVMAAGEWFLHWDNVPVYTAATVTDWLAARRVKMIEHPPYLPDLAPADFFLFPKVKKELAGLTLTRESSRRIGRGS